MSKHDTTWFASHRKFLLLLGTLLVTFLPSAAYAATCTPATVAGNYVVSTLGQEAKGYAATLFLMTSDGKGNLSGAGTESINGTISSNVTAAGTYTVNSDCSFTSTTTDSLGNIRKITGSILEHGLELLGISTGAGTDFQFTAYLQHLTQCTVASGEGYFVSKVQSPLTPRGSSIATQQWHINTKGAGNGSWVANFNNGTIDEGTSTATFSVNSDCTYTSTVTNSDGTTGHFFGVEGILEVNDVAWLSIETDNGWVSLGTGTALCSFWPHC